MAAQETICTSMLEGYISPTPVPPSPKQQRSWGSALGSLCCTRLGRHRDPEDKELADREPGFGNKGEHSAKGALLLWRTGGYLCLDNHKDDRDS